MPLYDHRTTFACDRAGRAASAQAGGGEGPQLGVGPQVHVLARPFAAVAGGVHGRAAATAAHAGGAQHDPADRVGPADVLSTNLGSQQPRSPRSGGARIRNLTRRFGSPLPVLGLAIAPGEFVALLGASGSAKTTLLRTRLLGHLGVREQAA